MVSLKFRQTGCPSRLFHTDSSKLQRIALASCLGKPLESILEISNILLETSLALLKATATPVPFDLNHIFFLCPILRNQEDLFWHYMYRFIFSTSTNILIIPSSDLAALSLYFGMFLKLLPPTTTI